MIIQKHYYTSNCYPYKISSMQYKNIYDYWDNILSSTVIKKLTNTNIF